MSMGRSPKENHVFCAKAKSENWWRHCQEWWQEITTNAKKKKKTLLGTLPPKAFSISNKPELADQTSRLSFWSLGQGERRKMKGKKSSPNWTGHNFSRIFRKVKCQTHWNAWVPGGFSRSRSSRSFCKSKLFFLVPLFRPGASRLHWGRIAVLGHEPDSWQLQNLTEALIKQALRTLQSSSRCPD